MPKSGPKRALNTESLPRSVVVPLPECVNQVPSCSLVGSCVAACSSTSFCARASVKEWVLHHWKSFVMLVSLVAVNVKNFKAINNVRIPLQNGITALIGQNSCGKSSILQAIHWACRCAAHKSAQRAQVRSIAPHDLDFFPTGNIRTVGHNAELRQGRNANPEISVEVVFEHFVEYTNNTTESHILIGRGNNDTVKIDLKSAHMDESFYARLKSSSQLFSTYIPGLAGIPLFEERRSRVPVLRQAASGDANAVLRNILAQIHDSEDEDVSLEILSQMCSKVLGDIELKIDFSSQNDFFINALIRTDDMVDRYWAPLELAGTGVLQCVQIFSYIILYRPHLLLIDEPDAHLHPDRQEHLMAVLANVAQEKKISIIITTHSPNVVRTLPAACDIVWIKDGKVAEEGNTVRAKMGWGVLDKSILLVTEDIKPQLIIEIIRQWPDIERHVAIWPVNGKDALPTADACRSFLAMTGMRFVVLHRDADFMTPDERRRLRAKYQDNVALWITDDSDIEALYLSRDRIRQLWDSDRARVDEMFAEIFDAAEQTFTDEFFRKRQLIAEDRRLYPGGRDSAPSHADARAALDALKGGFQRVSGKTFLRFLREKCQDRGLDSNLILSARATQYEIGTSLKALLQQYVDHL